MAEAESEKLYTLSDISQKTGISMPTLQRYKKMYQDRIPSAGQGRKQRYPESALPVFDVIKTENAGKRGRPRKDPSAPRPERPAASKRRPGRPARAAQPAAAAPAKRSGRPPGRPPGRPKKAVAAAPRGVAAKRSPGRPKKAAAAAAPSGRRPGRPQKTSGLLTLTQISETTGISYPTLVRYVRMHADKLPSEGKGRARRFYPQAVDVFRQLRSESGRGGRKKGSGAAKKPATTTRGRISAASDELSGMVSQRLKQLEKTQQSLEKKFKGFVDSLQKLFR
ncbi:MAG TPA: helix-turn-helix domain-containing protein [Thermoanaerobaculia bacterium]|jgi:predicted DNA-binding transcriptional regulator AlpA